jgi:hemerythrin-like domain-containing protein
MTEATDREANTPVESFSNCHVGIVGTMRELAELPDLLEPARRFEAIAAKMEDFFRKVVRMHHREEEDELFTAVLASAFKGSERTEVQSLIARLTEEHKQIEARFVELLPGIKAARKTADAGLNAAAIDALVHLYLAHAKFEEEVFLPLAKAILSRNGDHVVALGMALHMRHAPPSARTHYGSI